jgi:hypothetical protein
MRVDEEQEYRFTPDSVRANRRFRYWNVESALNRAADLLDRSWANVTEYKSLLAQAKLQAETIADLDAAVRVDADRDRWFAGNRAERKREQLASYDATHAQIIDSFWKAHVAADDVVSNNTAHASWKQAGLARTICENEAREAKHEKDFASKEAAAAQIMIYRRRSAHDRLLSASVDALDGSGLNYKMQAAVLPRRIMHDYEEASDYCLAALTGLTTIFGYRPQITLPGAASWGVQLFSAVDTSIAWVRAAIRWITAFSLSDQAVSASISLRHQISNWDDLRAGKICAFSLPPSELFGSLRYVRLRGIAATACFASPTPRAIQCRFTLPPSASYLIETESGAAVAKTVDQSKMPACIIGNVMDRSILRTPETAGTVSLANASPLAAARAHWSVRVLNLSGVDMTTLEDIVVEIRGVGQQPIGERHGV